MKSAYSDIFAIARQCQKSPRGEVLVSLVGSELVAFHRRITEGAQPRTTSGRRAEDKVDLVAQCAQVIEQTKSLIDVTHALVEELQSTRAELKASDAALKLATALLNRERGYLAPDTTTA